MLGKLRNVSKGFLLNTSFPPIHPVRLFHSPTSITSSSSRPLSVNLVIRRYTTHTTECSNNFNGEEDNNVGSDRDTLTFGSTIEKRIKEICNRFQSGNTVPVKWISSLLALKGLNTEQANKIFHIYTSSSSSPPPTSPNSSSSRRKDEHTLPTIIYNQMILIMCDNHSPSKAEEFLDMMKRNNVVRDTKTYAPLVDYYGVSHQTTKMLEVIESMFYDKTFVPDAIIYNKAIKYAGKTKDVVKMIRLFDIVSNNAVPKLETYNILTFVTIKYLARNGLLEKAFSYLKDLLDKGIQPNADTFNRIIYEHCARVQVEKVGSMWTEMRKLNVKPNETTIITLVYYYGRWNDEKMVCQIWEYAKSENLDIKPSQVMADTLLKCLKSCGELEMAMDVQREMTTLPGGGYVNTCFTEKSGTPRQPVLVPDSKAVLRLVDIWIIFLFHMINDRKGIKTKVRPPRLGEQIGVFATRSPHRPNPIGLSLAKIDKIEWEKGGAAIHLSGVDLLDNTPVLDIKPYIPIYDSLPGAKVPDWVSIAPLEIKFLPEACGQLQNLIPELEFYKSYDEIKNVIEQVLRSDIRSRTRIMEDNYVLMQNHEEEKERKTNEYTFSVDTLNVIYTVWDKNVVKVTKIEKKVG